MDGIVKNYNLAADAKAWYPPVSGSLTGTLTSTGKTVRGTNTLFLSELSVGDYLLNPANDELQIVERIESDTLLHVKALFTSGLSGTTCKRIKNKHLRKMRVVFALGAVGTIRGASQTTGGTWPINNVWVAESEISGLEPQLVTVGAGSTGHISTIE
jgi:hypothetical protein